MALNPKQEAFVAAYLVHPNATEAARTAGYRQPQSQGPRLLKNVEIAARVGLKVAQVAMSPDEVLQEVGLIARLQWEATIDPRAAMQGKMKALELIGKYHKMWVDKAEITGADGDPLQFTIVIDRRDADPDPEEGTA